MANEDRIFRDEQGQLIYLAPGNKRVPISVEQMNQITQSGGEAFLREVADSAGRIVTGGAALLGSEQGREMFGESVKRSETRAMVNPAGTMAASVLPDIAIGAATVGTGGIAAQAARAGITEAALGATRNPDNPLQGAAIQGTIGAAVPGAGAAIARGAARGAKMAQGIVRGSRAVDDAPAGFTPEWYQGRGSAARGIGAAIESNPITATATGAVRRAANNQNAMKRIAAESIGITDNIGDDFNDVLRRSQQRHKQFWEVDVPDRLAGVDINAGQGFREGIEQGMAENSRSIVKSDVVETVGQRILDKLDEGALTGADITTLRSQLGQAIESAARGGDTSAMHTFRNMQELLDDTLEKAMAKIDPEFTAQYAQMRSEYKHRLALQRGQAVNANGDINTQTLRTNMINSFGGKARARPEGNPLYDAANWMEQNKTGVGDSGTATRQMMNQAITIGLTGLGVGALN